MPRLIHQPSNQVLAEEVLTAHSFAERACGLLGRKNLNADQVMWIKPCSSIHTVFMKFPIDVMFTDKNLHIQAVHENIAPGKILCGGGTALFPLFWIFHPAAYNFKFKRKLNSVFEFKAGRLKPFNLKTGDPVHVGS